MFHFENDSIDDSFNHHTNTQDAQDFPNNSKTDTESSWRNPLIATRSNNEDMELETRALTEPLPTNQQVM